MMDSAAWGLQGCWGKRLLHGAGTLEQKTHSTPREHQGLSSILFLLQHACPSQPSSVFSLFCWALGLYPDCIDLRLSRAC